jgi:peptide subunit release factor 1 (eRF1)
MITREQLKNLLQFQDGEHLVTSCYLNLDRARMVSQKLKIRTKDLLNTAHQALAHKAGSHQQRESLREDFGRIEAFVLQEITTNHHKGLAIFSCSAMKFWQTYRLPRMVRNILIADKVPYIRPLVAILAEFHRYCALLVDQTQGKIFEIYMGEILEHTEWIDPVPRRVSEGGFGGREERQIERRHDHAVHQHLQKIANAAFALFKRDKFDSLILGGNREILREFKDQLHPYLKMRWVGDFHAEVKKMSSAEVLQHALEIEEAVELRHEQKMAAELVRHARADGRAVSGVSATLTALTRGEAQLLLVEDGFETPGFVCYDCHYVTLNAQECPNCRKPMDPSPDIVDDAIEVAMQKNCAVEHVHGDTPLRDAGRMGALLRYRVDA